MLWWHGQSRAASVWQCEIPAGEKKPSTNQQVETLFGWLLFLYISCGAYYATFISCHVRGTRTWQPSGIAQYQTKHHYCDSAAFCFLALGEIISSCHMTRAGISHQVLTVCPWWMWTHIWGRQWLWWWKEWQVLAAEINFPRHVLKSVSSF